MLSRSLNTKNNIINSSSIKQISLLARSYSSAATSSSKSEKMEPMATEQPNVTRRRRSTRLTQPGPSFQDFVSGNAANFAISDPVLEAERDLEKIKKLPPWLKVSIPKGVNYTKLKKDVKELKLSTVCEEAKCPNIGECWGGSKGKSHTTATIMLLGDTCTRGCRFCSVKTSRKPSKPDPMEPENTAEAISRWGLGYVVLTTVDRDDLADSGAAHLAETVRKIKAKAPSTLVETLSGDFMGNLEHVEVMAKSGLDTYAHNLETVEALTPFVRDRRATYRQSLSVLEHAKKTVPSLITKTSLMLGLGETDEQVLQTLKDLREINCDVVTFGQYMRPTKRHIQVVDYVHPDKFKYWKEKALEMGFLYCASGPLVRSSYKAGEAFIENVLRKREKN
ncbi:Lipoyl synthase [Hanseniaspora valbyensis NRRL Y-1626]|uniref:Lipoyl synthase, mitochondrial n=1 Tax=Hanseniaspora valbyensis NRRL Y-1626 TaxID=766949 RepID=A0A1B7TEM6_9ASCO|nr:Lipoyl synthase [Hanseniaspora valbyensis NRRL Y-1626]